MEFFGNVFSGAGIAYFEEIITSYVALVFFLPLLIDSGGNAGSQSATLMVRALATGDVKPNDWGKMLGREVFVALGLGLSMAAAVYLLGFFRGGYEIAMVVGLSMIVIVLIGSLIGTILPFGLHKLNLDPASASAPMITSIADISGVLIYFAIASAVLEIG
jgi:magnesium transporter